MTTVGAHEKIKPNHLKRDAYLYVRQSTLHQVVENTESSKRQYALRERALALGWPIERIHVIDCDQGQSGASMADRKGFQRLVAEVGMDRAGIVLGLEVSRLARNSSDWHRLLELCSLSDTLLLDEDGLYAPGDFNDRLLLGLKGAMSEAELHVLRSRLRGGILSKAKRGELRMRLPVGFIYDQNDRVQLDPDQRVRETIQLFFTTFERVGSATATVKYFRQSKTLFPKRLYTGPNRGQLLWAELDFAQALRVLHNPRYAGVFSYGRTRCRNLGNGKLERIQQPREEWLVFLPDSHDGYISLQQYDANRDRLSENAQSHGYDRRKSPAREGPALLQGLAICGVCGKRMTIRYHTRRGKTVPDYLCQQEGILTASSSCQVIPGGRLDEAIGTLLVESMTPAVLEVALKVQQELQSRIEDADRLRRKHVERARYEADLAHQRYMQVDPNNRLVADVLEAEWNQKLRILADAQEQYDKDSAATRKALTAQEQQRILALATDFPALWQDPKTPPRERKRMVRLLIEDVTLDKGDEIVASIRFRGGKTHRLSIPPLKMFWQLQLTPPEVVAEVDRLLNEHTRTEIASILNDKGLRSGTGKRFIARLITGIERSYDLKPRFDRLREAGMLTVEEMAKKLDVDCSTIYRWRKEGSLRAHAYVNGRYLYEPPGENDSRSPRRRKRKESRVYKSRRKTK